MISCKSGNWWELNAQRGRANNSAVLMRHKVTKEYFMDLWKRIELSGAGEPGIYLSNDKDWGTNPCCEIGLRPYQFCNLCEVNASDITSQEDFEERVKAASFIGTLQAGYTDFHYLRDVWKRTTEKDALIGVGMTGIGSGVVLGYDMKKGAKAVKEENERVAGLLGINKAARTSTVKPSGTSSLVLGTSSGIHAWHNDYYIRRIRVGKNEAIYTYLSIYHPELVEDEYFRPHDTAVISIPQKAPEGAIMRTESVFQLLERVKKVSTEWVKAGHRGGSNSHNVSATISVKENEWELVGDWMWENKDSYNGLSVLPYDGGTYTQAPFEDCTKETYDNLMKSLKDVDLTKIIELDDDTNLSGELACANGACEIK
jgi:ribonucleoside-diphosphate reductase alpha chain